MRAIKITPENAEKIAVINDGIAPIKNQNGYFVNLTDESYFIVPEDPTKCNVIYDRETFLEKFTFVDEPSSDFFTPIEEI